MQTHVRLFVILASLTLAGTLQAQPVVPGSINYQGTLVDALGVPLTDGNYELEFSIYDQSSGGLVVWGPFDFDGGVGVGHAALVPVVGGRFNVVLGPLDTGSRQLSAAFGGNTAGNGSRFIEMSVEGIKIGLRQQLLSTPFAFASPGMVPIGSILAYHADMPGAASLASLRAGGYALCDGTTASSQGITDAVITGTLPDLNVGDGTGRFLRGTTGTTTGTEQNDQIQGHFHSSANHFHGVTASGHEHGISNSEHSHGITVYDDSSGDRMGSNNGSGPNTSEVPTDNAQVNVTSVGDTTISVNIGNTAIPVEVPTEGAHGAPRVGDETFPKHMMVQWIIRVR